MEPKEVGTLAKVLIKRTMPIFFRPALGRAIMLPKKVGTLSKDIFQTLLRASQNVSVIPVWSKRSTPSNVHLSRGGLDIITGHKLHVNGQLQCRFLTSFFRC
jgi:hypothetical protein